MVERNRYQQESQTRRALLEHSQKRALSRYQLHLSPDLYNWFNNRIKEYLRAPNSSEVRRHNHSSSNGDGIFSVCHQGTWYLVAYNVRRQMVQTFLPPQKLDAKGVYHPEVWVDED